MLRALRAYRYYAITMDYGLRSISLAVLSFFNVKHDNKLFSAVGNFKTRIRYTELSLTTLSVAGPCTKVARFDFLNIFVLGSFPKSNNPRRYIRSLNPLFVLQIQSFQSNKFESISICLSVSFTRLNGC